MGAHRSGIDGALTLRTSAFAVRIAHNIPLRLGNRTMDQLAVWATMEAKPGKEREVEEHLRQSRSLIAEETGTTTFFALRIGPSTYGVFTTFADIEALEAHENGVVRSDAHRATMRTLFAGPPVMMRSTILDAETREEPAFRPEIAEC